MSVASRLLSLRCVRSEAPYLVRLYRQVRSPDVTDTHRLQEVLSKSVLGSKWVFIVGGAVLFAGHQR